MRSDDQPQADAVRKGAESRTGDVPRAEEENRDDEEQSENYQAAGGGVEGIKPAGDKRAGKPEEEGQNNQRLCVMIGNSWERIT